MSLAMSQTRQLISIIKKTTKSYKKKQLSQKYKKIKNQKTMVNQPKKIKSRSFWMNI